MTYFYRIILVACFLVVSESGCTKKMLNRMIGYEEPPQVVKHNAVSSHEKFMRLMKNKVGMKYDDPPSVTGINTQQLISSNILLNGNMENGYQYRGSCVYLLEINPDTQKIVKWRFEGSVQDCSIDK